MEDMEQLCKVVLEKGLSVRMTEELVRKYNRAATVAPVEEEEKKPAVVDYAKELEGRVMAAIGRRVRLDEKRGKKTITFFYEDNEDLEGFLRTLLGDNFFDGSY
jgi:ParB family chromosome partitioning protein